MMRDIAGRWRNARWLSAVFLGLICLTLAPVLTVAQPLADREQQAAVLFDAERYSEAAEALRAILVADPGNRTANILLPFALGGGAARARPSSRPVEPSSASPPTSRCSCSSPGSSASRRGPETRPSSATSGCCGPAPTTAWRASASPRRSARKAGPWRPSRDSLRSPNASRTSPATWSAWASCTARSAIWRRREHTSSAPTRWARATARR